MTIDELLAIVAENGRQMEAMRSLLLTVVTESNEKDKLIDAYEARCRGMLDLLLESDLSDGFLTQQEKAYNDLSRACRAPA